eukprot:CAMPEP_0196767764 /NCGR_PEP_ID=MMETSP1095-20130614/41933_1 /TAXON_ID=96789 ORGANISM="Chromulina nebulosa, Strain UTEXLB2642" /NCGR_SAMPLE_ID=MMETSP1095 /ASSEMBLY_ACC=CAM_ASM_000446 /LENGTH=172 /DNA_ID=CAMNT_0042136387 /DNA_START=927 /DNA_END=1445 /DNA_ORIENTATION=+
MLLECGLPKRYWTYAMNYAALIYNSTIKSRFNDNADYKYKSPFELTYANKPVYNFPIFGCLIVARNPIANDLPFLENKGRRGVFLGFDMPHHNASNDRMNTSSNDHEDWNESDATYNQNINIDHDHDRDVDMNISEQSDKESDNDSDNDYDNNIDYTMLKLNSYQVKLKQYH